MYKFFVLLSLLLVAACDVPPAKYHKGQECRILDQKVVILEITGLNDYYVVLFNTGEKETVYQAILKDCGK